MPYGYVQYVFYQTYTLEQFLPPPYRGSGKSVANVDLARSQAGHMVDVLKFAKGQLAAAPTKPPSPSQIKKNPNLDVLKVFVAPEFYLRSFYGKPNGDYHYGLPEVLTAREMIKQAVLEDSGFNDWLIIPGTAVYAQNQAIATHTPVLFNDAWAYFRATDKYPQVYWTRQKEYVSPIDGLDQQKRAMDALSPLRNLASFVNTAIVSVGGVDVGIEVCLDHYREVLKRFALHDPNQMRNVDVHVVTACGAQFVPASVAAKTGGYVLRNNGNNFALPQVQLFMVGAWPNNVPAVQDTPTTVDLSPGLNARPLLPSMEVLPPNLQVGGWQPTEMIGWSAPWPL